VANVYQAKDYLFKMAGDKAILGILPFFHSFGMTGVMNLAVMTGSWMLLFPKPPAMKELCETLDAVIRPGTEVVFLGAEVLFQKLADYLEAHPGLHQTKGKFTICISGAGPLHKPVQEKFEAQTGCNLREGYGLSECSPLVSLVPLYGERSFGPIGIPFRGTDWKILDLETLSRELPPGEEQIGELVVHGPQMMLGYHRNPDEGDDCFVEFEGRRWLKTGDLGYMDEQGYVTLKDRKKQLIKYKGYSIFPNEIEQLLCGHPAVKEVAAYGMPDPEVNEVIKVWVVLEPSQKGRVSEDDLRAWCRSNLTHYKVPRYIEFIDELPKTAVGKVQRRQLAEADPLYRKQRGQG
jgi:long-chain acyl-CoA synthetase